MTPIPEKYAFETGVYRPPSEGGSNSLLVRLTRNCPWNRCGFCGMYKTETFQLRPVDEIKRDIDAMAALRDDLMALADEGLHQGAIRLIGKHPGLNYHPGFAMFYHWLLSGGKTAFIQDANSLIMKTDQLVEVLTYLRQTFPSIVRITSYARSKTIKQKSLDELTAIRQAGLDRVHLGLESGDDAVLEMIRKGATAEIHILGGRKAKAAGFQLSEYWMPGLGGKACGGRMPRIRPASLMKSIRTTFAHGPFVPGRELPWRRRWPLAGSRCWAPPNSSRSCG